jgi:hypothetical protein
MQCGAVSGSVQTEYCLFEISQSIINNFVRSNVRAFLSCEHSVNRRCGVPTASPNEEVESCEDCSSTVPFLGNSFATRIFNAARSFSIATARRAEIQTII